MTSPIPSTAEPSALVAGRYQLLSELGRGAMGSIHRVLDRLTGRVVTLKRLRPVSPQGRDHYGFLTVSQERVALAQEFRVLASLRHPNVINVLDYGFDDEQQPFFTMDLQENAISIVDAAASVPLAVRIDLLVQMLRALMYMHRHGIIHRDLKPANVVVVNDSVRVLDFGLSVGRDYVAESNKWAGTLAYMAPEVLEGEPPSARSDLYAVGMIAYEILAGVYPFPCDNIGALHLHITRSALPRASDDIDPRLRPVLAGLLAKKAADRFQDGSDVIAALAEALPQERFALETAATRESFLQAAPLIGRAKEIDHLRRQLRRAIEASGSTWLVGGESGVGKSRLLEELRNDALVDGVTVARGHAVSHGGGPYHLWREVLRVLALKTELSDGQAAILKGVIPDIAALLDRPVDDAPAVDSDAAQARLTRTVEELFASQRQPALVVLEDLQWAGSESLRLLSALSDVASHLPLLIVGSFRDDEAPQLRELGPGIELLPLRRLYPAEVARLGQAMIGPAAERPELTSLLVDETEGIPFFIVEVIRALAETSGNLARIGQRDLPRGIMSGGMRRVLRRRLDRLSPSALSVLESAAVIGKELDRRLLEALHPEVRFDAWIEECSAAAVLDLHDQHWVFTHDKLREHLIEHESQEQSVARYRRVAEAAEREYGDRDDYVTALAHYWRGAGEPLREATYAQRAGDVALRNAAYAEAVRYFERALALLENGASGARATAAERTRRRRFLSPLLGIDAESIGFRLGVIEGGLAEAHYRLGELSLCRLHCERALARFHQPPPKSQGRPWARAIAIESLRRALQSIRRSVRNGSEQDRAIAQEITSVQLKLTETFIYSLDAMPAVWSVVRAINVSEPAGRSSNLGDAYVLGALVAGGAGMNFLADAWCRRALEIADDMPSRAGARSLLARAAVIHIGMCRWDEAASEMGRADSLALEIGDLRVCEETRTQAGILALYHGPLEAGLGPLRTARDLLARSRSRQGGCWIQMAEADLLLRLGRLEEARTLYDEAIGKLDEQAMLSEAIWAHGGLALTRLRLGESDAAYAAAARALEFMLKASFLACWTQQGMAATAEVLLALWDRGWKPGDGSAVPLGELSKQACGRLADFARRFKLGRAQASLWTALHHWLAGRPGHAERMWRRTVDLATRLDTPYERGRAHLELGLRVRRSRSTRVADLAQAARIFQSYGSERELRTAREALDALETQTG